MKLYRGRWIVSLKEGRGEVLYNDQDSIATAASWMYVARLPVSVLQRDWIVFDIWPEANHEKS